MNVEAGKAGEWMDDATLISDVDFAQWPMHVPTDRYNSQDYAQREFENLWLKVWQIAGHITEIPNPGDWKTHEIYDYSFLLVRGKDGLVRGFVNACRHRGNELCRGKGNAARFTCKYHNWTFGLEGQALAVAHPDYDGPLEEFVGAKKDLGLIPVSVECFGGFIFINPARNAEPLEKFLGPAKDVLEAYRMEEWVPVNYNVREEVECNWKVVMDAFGESYHIQGVHSELLGISDTKRERFQTFGDHCAATVPFGPDFEGKPEEEVANILGIPTQQFPLYGDVQPKFAGIIDGYRDAAGTLNLPDGLTPRKIFQDLIREELTGKGYDVSKLTDTQMTNYSYWLFFPNVFIQITVGDATIIVNEPHPSGDHNKCIWHTIYLHWYPEDERAAKIEPVKVVPAGEHYHITWVMDQDYEQMPIQQRGLRNKLYDEMYLTRSEPRVAHFHAALDKWIGRANGAKG